MSDEFDFSELRNYLQGQMDLGSANLWLDEPWTLTRTNKAPKAAPTPVRAMPTLPQNDGPSGPALVMSNSAQVPQAQPAMAQPAAVQPAPMMAPASIDPAPRPVRKAVSAFESVETLDAFYGAIASEAVYAGASDLFKYEGPQNPRLLLLLPAPRADIPAGTFLGSPVGDMLTRLFASLNIEQSNIGVTYLYKSPALRNLPPLLETALRKMLTKELSFIAPQTMVTFGEPLFHQVFGKAKSFEEFAGTDQDFNGVKTCSLVDAFAMAGDKQLKWLTWKVHIPRGTYFKA